MYYLTDKTWSALLLSGITGGGTGDEYNKNGLTLFCCLLYLTQMKGSIFYLLHTNIVDISSGFVFKKNAVIYNPSFSLFTVDLFYQNLVWYIRTRVIDFRHVH